MVTIKSKYIKFAAFAVAVLILGGLTIFNGVSAAGLFFNKKITQQPIAKVETSKNQIALTFNLTTSGDKTITEVLKQLDDKKLKATFFISGDFANENKELVKQLDEKGFEIGILSNTNKNLTTINKNEIKTEISKNIEAIKSITDKTPTLFRPPFMAFNDAVIDVAKSLNLKTVGQTITITGDSAGKALIETMQNLDKGSILTFDAKAETATNLDAILRLVVNKGIETATISTLLIY
jgi:peptidoglycan/xylan/chitin deacetylase (PgdA/CDA1 family)